IAVTGIGAGDSRGTGGPLYARFFQPLFLGQIYADKDLEEKIIKDSDLDWVIVRPGFLTRLPKTGRYQASADRKDWRGGFITRADVAEFLIDQVASDEFVHKTPLLIG
ncbi:MAG: NAD(P)-dependent oxidoreductase, partial [Methyloligellaceae bacterium]